MEFEKPNIIVSKCLEFDSCRWDGVMISSPLISILKDYVEFIPVCPEVEIGLSVPRKSIRIVLMGEVAHLIQNETSLDVTDEMNSFCSIFLDSLQNVDGFILKDQSPSCGIGDVKIYPSTEKVSPLPGKKDGFFGSAVKKKFGHLAIENEGRFNDFATREHFLTKLFIFARFRKVYSEKRLKDLVNFHWQIKFQLMAYNQSAMKKMGRIVANHEQLHSLEVFELYKSLLFKTFSKIPRYTSNINVLLHGLDCFSKEIALKEKEYFLDAIEKYRANKVPLSFCITLINSWIVRFDEKYLREQSFFNPYPEELNQITDEGRGRGK